MSKVESPSDPATVVITHRVRPGREKDYEKWLGEIGPVCKSAPGHWNTTVIAPVPGATDAYTVIIRFDARQRLIDWMESTARKELIKRAQPCLASDDKFFVSSGLDFWFTPEGAKARLPKRWKQFLLTWSAIYPLVLFAPLVLGPVFGWLRLDGLTYVKALFSTGFIVFLMAYVVMPRYTKLVHKWLFR
jgi:antibiotic biosynthesis monooxygenase (ABM) superfamily enzyme